jgi:predicted Zn-dependent protease
MNKLKISFYVSLITLTLGFFSCSKDGGGINLFSIEQDKEFGAQTAAEIARNPGQYPVLSEQQNAYAYQYLRGIRDRILNSGKVEHKADFNWDVYIIKDDTTLNAFCTPGGHIYVYTGLIKYLDTEDQLAGVMGHEIAHADKRHTTRSMTTQYGYDVLLGIVLGKNQGALTQIATQLVNLKYSRSHESEADQYSVVYLCPTGYKSDGAAGFFEKLLASGNGGGTPEFLSTHPNPDNRVQAIQERAQKDKCNTQPLANSEYQKFKSSLP